MCVTGLAHDAFQHTMAPRDDSQYPPHTIAHTTTISDKIQWHTTTTHNIIVINNNKTNNNYGPWHLHRSWMMLLGICTTRCSGGITTRTMLISLHT